MKTVIVFVAFVAPALASTGRAGLWGGPPLRAADKPGKAAQDGKSKKTTDKLPAGTGTAKIPAGPGDADQLDKDIKLVVSGKNPARTFAIRRLSAYQEPVAEKQAEVAAALMASIEKSGDGYNEMRALAIWATPAELEKVPKYIGRGAMTKAAIYVLGKKKATAAVKQVAACLEDGGGDGKALVQALIEIGPACEEYALPFLTEQNRGAAHRALQVLAEVGGKKSLEPVRALTTAKKADLVMPAKTTLARIEDRLAAAKDK